MKISRARGTRDLLDDTLDIFLRIESAARDVFERFGYRPIRTPIFERSELFVRSVGEETDIVSKEMYDFQDRGGRGLTLRPEGTAGAARAVVENKLIPPGVSRKFYYTGPMFRYERPQAGRYREFWQTGVEAFGADDPLIDAETILCAQSFLGALDVGPTVARVNSVGGGERTLYAEALQRHMEPRADQLGPEDRRRLEKNPLRLLDSKDPAAQRMLKDAPSILDYLSEESRGRLDAALEALNAVGVEHTLDPRIVRGLDYYTGLVFEIAAEGLGAQDVVIGGGRYDRLIEQLGGKPTPGIGFAAGVDRLALAMEARGKASDASGRGAVQVWFVSIGGEAKRRCFALLNEARRRGVRADMEYSEKGLRAQLKTADRSGAEWAVILGGDELERGEASLKNMRDRAQETAPLDAVIDTIVERLEQNGCAPLKLNLE